MRPGKRVEVVIEETIFPSIGIAKVGDKEIQVKNAIKGEKVLVQVMRKSKID